MLPEVEAKMERLVGMYVNTEYQVLAMVSGQAARGLPTRREQTRLLGAIQNLLVTTAQQKRAQAAGSVRLAFLRAARANQPLFAIKGNNEVMVENLSNGLIHSLSQAEMMLVDRTARVFKDLRLEQISEGHAPVGLFTRVAGGRFNAPLEHYVRATAHTMLEDAAARGAAVTKNYATAS